MDPNKVHDMLTLKCSCGTGNHRILLDADPETHNLLVLIAGMDEAGGVVTLSEAQVVELANWLKSQMALWYFTRTASTEPAVELRHLGLSDLMSICQG